MVYFRGHDGLNFSQALFGRGFLLWGRRGGLGSDDRLDEARSCRSCCDLVARRGLCFLFRWWRRHLKLTKKIVEATFLKEVEGGSLLVGAFGEGLVETAFVVGGEVKEPS